MRRKGMALFLALCLSLTMASGGAAAAGSSPFADVPAAHWASQAVTYVYDNGLMNGVGEDTFQPGGSLTRAMFVTILGRMAGAAAGDYPGTSFTDVPAGQWYSPYVAWAAQAGVADGTGGGKFSPDNAVTREQMATMIARYTESAGLTLDEVSDPAPSFTDQGAVASWAREGVDLMRCTGILTGYEDGSFQPQRTANRAEAAAIFMRLDQATGELEDMVYMVTFDTGGGSAVPPQQIRWGQTVQEPAPPTREGFRFVGWRQVGTEGQYDFSAPVTKNLTLTAEWVDDVEEDTVYTLTEDQVSFDGENGVAYVNNILLAFVEPDLSAQEKEEIAKQVQGEIVGDISGGVNVLQIGVHESTLSELEAMAEVLRQDPRVNYVTCDYPLPSSDVANQTVERTSSTDGNWWYSAIRADEAWKVYGNVFGDITVGVIDNGVESKHPELSGKVSFASPYYQSYNNLLFPDAEKLNHGTHVSGIIAANNDGNGMTGVAPQAEIVFASYMAANEPTWNTALSQIHALKSEIEQGAKVINCSFGVYYYDQAEFEQRKQAGEEGFQYDSYGTFLAAYTQTLAQINEMIAAATCDLIRTGEDFLVVQSAGNGVNNVGPGVNAWYTSYWAGLSETSVGSICEDYGLSYDQLDSHILIVSGVKNEKNGNCYAMETNYNYGQTVDICAPSVNIYSSVYDAKWQKYALYNGTSMAAPMVTGAAALVWSANPMLTGPEVRDILLEKHQYIAQGTYVGETYTYPMLDVYTAVEAAVQQKRAALVGVYEGSYFATQGETGLTLTIYEEAGTYRALFEFYNLPGHTNAKEGSYTMEVTVTSRGTARFTADEWIEQPSDYVLLNLEGVLQNDVLSGQSPTPFSVTKVSDTTSLGEKTPGQIAQAITETSEFTWNWFYDNQHTDKGDTIQAPYQGGTWTYERVTGMNTKTEVLALARSYYDVNTASEAVALKEWVEQDGKLYVSATEGLGGIWPERMDIQVERENALSYRITCREYLFGELYQPPYELRYSYQNGNWVFDQLLILVGVPITT